MNIPFVSFQNTSHDGIKDIRKRITRIISSGDFILGRDVTEFEESFARYIGTRYAVGLASGTDALLLSLRALGVQQGDEVIAPAMTFIASITPIIQLGAKPIFVDILPTLPLINPQNIERAITKKTKAIIVVHLYGFPCDMERIFTIARRYKLHIIEDACQAHGSTLRGKHMGSLGDVGCFSFYPSKNLGAFGDAGAVTTSDKKIKQKITILRNHGQIAKYRHDILGYNSRLDTLQAAVLRKKLTHLDRWNAQRRSIAGWYDMGLKNLPVVTLSENADTKTNYHIYAIRTFRRNALLRFLKTKGIHCGIHYPTPIHMLKPFAFLGYRKGSFPQAESFARDTLSLPIFPQLKQSEVQTVIQSIKQFFRKRQGTG